MERPLQITGSETLIHVQLNHIKDSTRVFFSSVSKPHTVETIAVKGAPLRFLRILINKCQCGHIRHRYGSENWLTGIGMTTG
jgi:hypothetical protein